jgi:hypothetical protein
LVYVQVVIGKDLTLVDVLSLSDCCSIEVEDKVLSVSALDLLHLRIIAERQMVDGVREVKLPAVHVDHLNDLAEGVGGEMEVARHLIDDQSALKLAAFFCIHGLDGLLVD